jgi:glycyl-tRNA synthetase
MDIDGLLGFAKRTGFFWPAAEIYGGVSGIFDYGHLGAALKRNFESAWLSFFVNGNGSYHLIEGSNMLPERPLIASGHASRFTDVVVGCSSCKTYYRADVLLNELGVKVPEGAKPAELEAAITGNGVKCPKCKGKLMQPKEFNMMIEVSLGPERADRGYLRPETAQSTYLNFFREFNLLRKRLPLGLAIIGRAYRNEISPRQGLYRMRELTQAELQIFFDPENWKMDDPAEMLKRKVNVVPYSDGKARDITGAELVRDLGIPEFYAYHMCLIAEFYETVVRLPHGKLRFFEKGGVDRAFYNKLHMDIEADIESWSGFREIGGLHYRGDYDLSSHSKGSGQDLSVDLDGRKVMPNVLELSFGVDRNVWMLIDAMYVKDGERTVLKIPVSMAPYSLAVFPLQKDEKLVACAEKLCAKARKRFKAHYDESGSIGRRYARMDEVGTPFCVTVDFDTVDEASANHGTVTVRERDTKKQDRVKLEELCDVIRERLG